jgi:hypothetical protein
MTVPIPPTRLSTDYALRSMADVVEDLFNEFAPALAMDTVVRVVRRCGRELAIDGSSSTYLLHTRAHSRLQDRATSKQTTSRGRDREDSHRSGHEDERKSS